MLKRIINLSFFSMLALSNLSANEDESPWLEFISARKDAIEWLKESKGYNDSQIAKTLSIDEQEVYLIRTTKIKLKTPN